MVRCRCTLFLMLVVSVIVWNGRAYGESQPSVYDFTVHSIDGEPVSLDQYRGYVLLVVNTASRCGFTKQYEGLQSLHTELYDRGLRILGFPSNDFLMQEPGSAQEIKQFCQTRFQITFDLFDKVHVIGRKQHPLFRFLTTQEGFKGRIRWNFHKFVISRQGDLVARFGTRVAPESPELREALQNALNN